MTKLLIVEDNEQSRYMLQKLLEGKGYEVVSAPNGAEALEEARRDPPDMLIADILMPVMDGFTLCREWKKDDRLKKIPFVFYTATYTDPRDEDFALSLGAERFIVKPVEPDVFVGMLEEVIEKHKAGRLVAPRQPLEEEEVYLKEYNRALVRKMEDKLVELKDANRALEESEQRYRLLAENVTDVIWTMDMHFRITYISPSVRLLRGYSVEEALSMSLEQTLMPSSLEAARNVLAEELAMEEREEREISRSRTLDLELRRKDGSTVWGETKMTFLRDAEGRPIGILGVTRDTTERRKAQEALRKEKEKYRTLVEESPFGVSIIGRDGSYKYVNPEFVEMFGYTLEDIPTGREWFAKAYPDGEYRKQAIRTWSNDLKEAGCGEVRPRVFTVRCKDGSEKVVHFRPVTLESGDQFVIYEDITERTRAEEEKRQLQDQLAQAQKTGALGTLAGGIAHEFNNIIAAMIGYVDLTLQTEELSETARRNLEVVRTSGARGANLTKSLLAFSRRDVAERKRMNLRDVVDEVLKVMEKQLTGEGIELVVKHSMKVPPMMGNADMLASVVMNLVINARHAMTKSKVKNLAIQTGQAKGRIFLRVSDTGCGIAAEDIPRVFDPFFTTKGALAAGEVYDGKARGTGLGLSVCRNIIERHGGEITVESEVGRGTTFTVYLPPVPKHRTLQSKGKELQREEGTRIAVIDDEEAITDLLVSILEHAGYEVDGFTNPREAARAVRREQYALAFVDLQMPEMSGEDLMKELNSLPPEQRPVAVILTGRLDAIGKDYSELEAFSMLAKPFAVEEVLAVVREGLAARRRRGRA
jgi:PAS domain S-box-containing protein